MRAIFVTLAIFSYLFTLNLLSNENYLENQKNQYIENIKTKDNITILYDIIELWNINNYFDDNPFKETLKDLKTGNKLLDSYLDIYRYRAKLEKNIAYIDNYYLIGPFDNQGSTGFENKHKAEDIFSKKEVFKGKNQELKWKTVSKYVKPFINFKNFLNPKIDSLGYMLVFIDIKKSGKYQVRFGTNNQFELFLDKKSVLKSDNHGELYYDQNIIELYLKKGVHSLLAKVAKKHEDWGVYLRVLNKNGKADPKNIQFVLQDKYPAKYPKAKVLSYNKSIKKQLESIKNKDYKYYIKKAVIEKHFVPYDKNSKPYPYEEYLKKSIELAKTDLEKGEAYYSAYLYSSNRVDIEDYLDKAVNYLYYPAILKKINDNISAEKLHTIDKLIKKAERIDKYDYELLFLIKRYNSLFGVNYLNRIIKKYQESHRVSKYFEFKIDKIKFGKLSNLIKIYEYNKKYFYFRISDTKELLSLYLQDLDFKNYEKLVKQNLKKSYLSYDYNISQIKYLFSKKRYNNLIDLFKKREELLLDSPSMVKILAMTYQILGDKENSLKYYDKYLILKPNDSKIKEYIAFVKTSKNELWAEKFIKELEKNDIKYSEYKANGLALEKLYEHLIIKVNDDYSYNIYRKTAIAVNNLEAVKKFKYLPIYYLPNNERVSNSHVRIIKPNGEAEEITSYRDRFYRSKRNGAFTNYSVRGYYIPNLEKGDIIEYSYYLKNNNIYEDPFYASVYYLNSFAGNKRATFTFLTRNKKINFNTKSKETNTKNGKKYFFEFKDLKQVKSEPSSTGYSSNYKFLSVSTLNTWQEVTNWYKGLLLKQNILSESVKKEIHEGTDKITNETEKIKWIQKYLFEHTHYVGIELGLNAYKPFSATKVLERKYGDCKDKANLFNSLLKEIGIKSEIVLLRTNSLGQIKDSFPPNPKYFNHAISYLPKLDIFVDLTADKNGLFDLPFSDQASTGIIIKDKEVLRQLPSLESKQIINIDGSKKKNDLLAKITVKYLNSFSSGLRYRLENKEGRKNYLQAMLKPVFNTFEIKSFKIEGLEDINKELVITMDILVKNFFDKKRIYNSIFIKKSLENEGLLDERIEGYKRLKLTIEENINIKGISVTKLPSVSFGIDTQDISYNFTLKAKNNKLSIQNKFTRKSFSVAVKSYKGFKKDINKIVSFMQKTILIGDK